MARKRLSVPFGPGDLPQEDNRKAGPSLADPASTRGQWPEEQRAIDANAALPGDQRLPAGRRMPPTASPISHVAREASATAALEALAGEVAQARATGRMIETISLDAVETDYLVRDRVALDEAEMTALVESLRSHGQRMPVDLVDLGPNAPRRRYGLISGWRRITALRQLHDETGEERFGQVLALLRRPEAAGEAYIAMVEENEIRAGLSYYERARIAARAVEAGAFADRGEALRALYATASRAKRSKIGSFLMIVDALDGALRFPGVIPERLGLALAARLAEPEFGAALAAELAAAPSQTAAAETARLTAALARTSARNPRRAAADAPPQTAAGSCLSSRRGGGIVLTGPGVDAAFRARLEKWLQRQ